MTPKLLKEFNAYVKSHKIKLPKSPFAYVNCCKFQKQSDSFYRSLYDFELKPDTVFDAYGVAQEAGSEDCYHLRKMAHPLKNAETLEEVEKFPFPKFSRGVSVFTRALVMLMRASGRFVVGSMQCTSWEQAWYIRSMEMLLIDMIDEPSIANFILDKVTDNAVINAQNYAQAGVDAIYLGDDVGMQSSLIMSEEMYVTYLKPRLKRVIDSARAIKPNILIFYHSCGYVEPLIKHFIDCGVNVLNPIQPECMKFEEIFDKYGDKLSFFGTIGTQTTMPFGSVEDVKKEVIKNLDYAGAKGGLIVSPTHVLEPEVPIKNILAYFEACESYKGVRK